MILLITGVPSFREEAWPHATEAYVFAATPEFLDELKVLGRAMRWTEWRPQHCPPHWRITEEEAALLDFPRVDGATMTIYARGWRRHMNETFREPQQKSHKRQNPPGQYGRPKGARPPQ